MKKITYDIFGKQDPPIFILSSVYHKHYGTITNIDPSTINENINMNSADEISFDVYKDVDGKECELWNKIISFKYVYVPSHEAYYKIDVSMDEDDKNIKHITGTAAGEVELSNRTIVDMHINTASDIEDRNPDQTKEALPVLFYQQNDPKHSLLDITLKDKAPDWSIGHVDPSLWNEFVTFDVSGQTIYDFLTNTVANEIQCLFKFDSVNRVINVYDLTNYCNNVVDSKVCGYRGDRLVCPKCGNTHLVPGYGNNTGIYISTENFAQNITIDGDEGNVKNCFRITGGDEEMNAAVINCNPGGSAYIYEFSEDDYADMPEELVTKLQQYAEDFEASKPTTAEYAEKLYDALTKYYYYKDSMMPRADTQHWKPDTSYNVNQACYVITLPSCYHFECYSVSGTGKTGWTEPDATDALKDNLYVDGGITWKVVMNMGDLPTAEAVLHDAEDFITNNANKVFYETIPISDASVRSAVKNLISVEINPLFNVTLSDGTINPPQDERTSSTASVTWTGRLTITNTTNKDDVATSRSDVTATLKKANSVQEHEEYIYQYTKKRLDRADTTFTDLYDIEIPYDANGNYIKEQDTTFSTLLKEYSLNMLKGFYDSYVACRDILIQNGVNKDHPNLYGANMYKHYVIPYNGRIDYIDKEMKLREATVKYYYNDPSSKDYSGGDKGQVQVWQDALDVIHDQFNLKTYLGDDLYKVFYNYMREGSYQNSNYVSTGLSDNVLIQRAQELFQRATEELAKAKELQISLDATLGNLLNTKEFENYKDKFELGDYIMCRADDTLYKLRLLSISMSWNDPGNIGLSFSNLTKSKTFMSDIQDVVSQAKSISTSYTGTMRQVEQNSIVTGEVADWTREGLSSALVRIKNNNHEEISYDENGIIARQFNDVENDYDPHQLKITHDMIAFTEDNWNNASLALGRGEYREYDTTTDQWRITEDYGLIAKFVTAGVISGSQIIGGNIYSNNYTTSGGVITSGTHLDLQHGTFEMAGGLLRATYNGSNYGLYLKGEFETINNADNLKTEINGGKIHFYKKNGNVWNDTTDLMGTITAEASYTVPTTPPQNFTNGFVVQGSQYSNYVGIYRPSEDHSGNTVSMVFDCGLSVNGFTDPIKIYDSAYIYYGLQLGNNATIKMSNKQDFITSSNTTYGGTYISVVKSPRVFAGNYVHGDYVLDVTGNSYFTGTSQFKGAATFDSTVSVNNAATFNGTATFNNATSYAYNLNICCSSNTGTTRAIWYNASNNPYASIHGQLEDNDPNLSGLDTCALYLKAFNGTYNRVYATSGGDGTTSTYSMWVIAEDGKTHNTQGFVGSISGSSSRTIKKNIESISLKEAEKIYSLDPVKFDFKKDETNNQLHRGFIAEDVLKVIPNIVEEFKCGDSPYGINYIELIPYLVKVVQDQKDRIETLEKTIREVTNK